MLIPILAAPTASGKTALALELARTFPLEIISADAMLVYKGMDIGTAKPSSQDQAITPHHVIDVVMPDEPFSVANYVSKAEKAIAEVLSRKRIPLVVGGTGFYIRALVEGLPTVPAADFEVQQLFWHRLEQEGLEPLHQELLAFSPEDAARAQRNPRRVIRALEIIQRTGKAPLSFKPSQAAFSYSRCIFLPSLESLKPRIAKRTQQMLEAGWLEEVKKLLDSYPTLATAKQALGYDILARHLKGDISLTQANDLITQATLNYAKRQRTWFRKEHAELRLDSLAENASAEVIAWLENLAKT